MTTRYKTVNYLAYLVRQIRLISLVVFSSFCMASESHKLEPVKNTHLDELYTSKLMQQVNRVQVLPIQIHYPKNHGRIDNTLYRPEDYYLSDKAHHSLQNIVKEYLEEQIDSIDFIESTSTVEKDSYSLFITFDQFRLGAPLREHPAIKQTWVKTAGSFSLYGKLVKTDTGEVIMSFNESIQLGRYPDSDMKRFTSVLFWHEVRLALKRVFRQLNQDLNLSS